MDKKEFEQKVKELNLKKVRHRLIFKNGYDNNTDYYVTAKQLNIYGCKKDHGEYAIFFKDSERGITTELGRFKNANDAYDKLYETIVLWEKEHKRETK